MNKIIEEIGGFRYMAVTRIKWKQEYGCAVNIMSNVVKPGAWGVWDGEREGVCMCVCVRE